MFEGKTDIISESTYTDKQGFEIREGLNQDGNRVLLKVCGSGAFFSIPDGIFALEEDAFSEVTETMSYVFIPKSVQIIPAYTFTYFRGKRERSIGGKELHELHILCEAVSRPEGFYVEVIEDTFEEDYEFYTEYRYKTWCGYGFRTERVGDGYNSDNIVTYGFGFPYVHWGVSAQESLKYCEN